jgi:hypothetical protein
MDEYLTEREAADFLSRKPQTVRKWRVCGKGPKYLKDPNGRIRYSRFDLELWIRGGHAAVITKDAIDRSCVGHSTVGRGGASRKN